MFICDIYNPGKKNIDHAKLQRANIAQQVTPLETDDSYLSKVQFKVLDAISASYPDFIIYVAGYDLVEQD